MTVAEFASMVGGVLATRILPPLFDVLSLVAAVLLVLAVGRLPWVKRSRAGSVFRDVGRGVRRLFVSPVARARARTGGSPGWYLLVVVPGIFLVSMTPLWARLPVVLLAAWVAGRGGDYDDDPSWWSNRNLVDALVTSGGLKPPREGEGQLNLSYRGVQTNDAGTTVKVALPQAQTLTGVLARRDSLAAALRVPVARVEVTQADDDPANVVTLWVGTGTATEVPASVTQASHTTWTDPVRIGVDTRGHPVELATVEANTIVGGIPGAGKTSVARIIMGAYLLDPTTSIYALDGKGSKADYGATRPLCTRFVSGVDEDAVDDTIAMLTEVLDLVRTRNASGEDGHPGVLVVLEELQDVRAAADKVQRERLDNCLGRVVRMGRAVSVHVLISTQRPSVDDVPSGVRNLLSQRVALKVRNPADAALILGTPPTLDLPTRRGQALLTTPTGTRTVHLDRLTGDAWTALCARASALRGATHPQVPVSLSKPSQAPTERQEANTPMDPFLEAVLDVLADSDPAGIPATELHDALPEWAHDLVPTPRDLGIELRNWAAVERVSRRNASGTVVRVWRSVNGQCQRTVNAVSSLTLVDTQKAISRAQVGASDSAGVKAARAGVPRP